MDLDSCSPDTFDYMINSRRGQRNNMSPFTKKRKSEMPTAPRQNTGLGIFGT